MSRRKFFGASALTGAAMLTNPLETMATPAQTVKASAGFELIILATNWGYQGSAESFCTRIKESGYDGAEMWCPGSDQEARSLMETFKNHGLRLGFLVGGSSHDFKEHYQQFETLVKRAASLNPLYINCHSGRDYFPFEQNRQFIDLTLSLRKSTGVPLYHETHRSRILYAGPVGRQYMETIPDLRLTLDISHWCNVHETLLGDQPETVAMAIGRADHIHARIGHPEGPQVNDPRAPEWKAAVDAHFAWWDQVVANKKKAGQRMTILTEFGPIDYMPAMPYTRQPLSSQWDINVYMLDTLRKRYA